MMLTNRIAYMIRPVLIAGFLAGCSHGGSSLPPIGTGNLSRADASFQTVYSFGGEPDGATPNADLISMHGALVGTTAVGGTNDLGTVFSMTEAGAETVLFNFLPGDTTSGSPNGGVIDVGGTLYGTTIYAAFALSSTGQETVLHLLSGGRDGDVEQGPLASLKGELFGATQLGGTNACNSGCGTVYAVARSGGQRGVYDFRGKRDGFEPQGGLIVFRGQLYGTTSYGGTHGAGTIYRLTSSGKKTIVYNFTNNDDGTYPTGKLAHSGGTLYVAARYGGAHGYGAIVAIARSGKATVLHAFAKGSDGGSPNGSLLLYKGVIYGTTLDGGGADEGTIFALTKDGKERVIHVFHGGDGAQPQAGLVLLNGMLYGTTFAGGAAGKGTVFRFRPD